MNYYKKLLEDIRFVEGLKACINCGTCTAICAASEFYNYDPRLIVDAVQMKDDSVIEELLKSETIWYCGECMSCKTRCPRGNAPGLIIMALRSLSQDTGLFAESEKGRQQLLLKRVVGEWILKYGYCLYAEEISPDAHPEQGKIWEWKQKNVNKIFERLGANYKEAGPGILRKIPQDALDEIYKIFEVTGAIDRFNKLESISETKAKEMNLKFDNNGISSEYCQQVYKNNENKHSR